MFGNFLKVAFRNVLKHKGHSFINIAGLAIGLASFILIMLFVRGELSYDRFHESASQTYRMALKYYIGSSQFDVANGPFPLAEALVADFPEVEAATRLYSLDDAYISFENRQFLEERFLWADSNVFDLFDIELVEGDARQVLTQPNSIVVTPEIARKYFGERPAVGQTLRHEDGTLYKVTGLAKALPANSHFHFDFLASFSTREESRSPDWLNVSVYTYFRLQDGVPVEQLDAKIPDFTRKYIASGIEERTGSSYDEFIAAGNLFGFFIQPLTDIHLKSDIHNEFEAGGSYNTVIIFAAVSIVILLVACINFVNLATARSTERANEVGVRKAVGSSRRQLVWQFLAESVFLSAVAVVGAVVIACNFIPLFNNLLGTHLSLTFLTEWYFVPSVIALILAVGAIAGAYPALMLSSFRPVSVLKGKYESSTRGRWFRSVLVVLQFTASIVLLVGTIVIHNQLQYVNNKELGFNKDQVVVIRGARELEASRQAFRNEVLQSPHVLSASYSDDLPQLHLSARVFQREGAQNNDLLTFVDIMADEDFKQTYGFRLAEGRYFEPNRMADSTAILVNRAGVAALGLEDPVGKRLIAPGEENRVCEIVGVVEDFHLESFHQAIRPMSLRLIGERPARYLSVHIRSGETVQALGQLETLWDKFVPSQPIDYGFIGDAFAEGYIREVQASKVVSAFSVLAVFIACLGLFGLASFTAGRRSKEIGIRKVLGATVSEIIVLLSKEFVRWVLLANLIAWPIAYFAMSRWLEGFAYRTNLGIATFALAGIMTLLIAILTVSYQAVRAARANPVDSIQYE